MSIKIGERRLTALGKLHRLARRVESHLEKISFFHKHRVHLAPEMLIYYGALQQVEKIDDKPDDIFSYDWKNLVILDGCRHDTYEEVNGQTDYRLSKSSMSKGFIKKNFSDGDFSDIVYITANPFFHESKFKKLTGKGPNEVFHEVFHTYKTDWDKKENTILPEKVYKEAKTAEQLFPNKKKIIHFMQPHHPFIGYDFIDKGFEDILERGVDVSEWDLAMRGKISHEEVSEAYENNLKEVMPYVEKIADFEGKTMVTSDHGNLLGENGLYWHPPRSKAKPLRKIPMTEL